MGSLFEHVKTQKIVEVEYTGKNPFTGRCLYYFKDQDTPKGVHMELEKSEFDKAFKEVPRDG